MKVLFISSGNSKTFSIAPFIKSQAESIIEQGIEIDFYTIIGNGIIGYIKNIIPLRKKIKNNNFDLLHAHYALAGWVGLLTLTRKPLVVSYMGCDTYGDYNEKGKQTINGYLLIILGKLLQPFVSSIIVKSNNLAQYIFLKKKINIIPNGVNLKFCKISHKTDVRNILSLDSFKRYVLFLGSPKNSRKNFNLVKKATELIKDNVEILKPYPVNHELVSKFLLAADILILTSFNEGSPNVIKEALACNTPIVSTNVGDVAWLIKGVEGCYLTTFEPEDVADKIKKALEFSEKVGKTNGRERIIKLGLDSETIAKRIIDVYKKVLNQK